MSGTPSPNRANGRTSNGRFAKGNAGGPGNPHAKRVSELRAALLDAVTVEDLREVVASLTRTAKEGDTQAVKVLLDRLLGPSVPLDIVERLEALESRLSPEASK
ncbi:MAG: hypothetical protein AAF593_00355 [Planctomycetota bacterium]